MVEPELFYQDDALKFGLHAAIVLQKLQDLQLETYNDNTIYHNGKYWVVASMQLLLSALPYLSKPKIRKAISILQQHEILRVECYNTDRTDTTKWYHVRTR